MWGSWPNSGYGSGKKSARQPAFSGAQSPPPSVLSNTPPPDSPRYRCAASRGSTMTECSIEPSGVFSSGYSAPRLPQRDGRSTRRPAPRCRRRPRCGRGPGASRPRTRRRARRRGPGVSQKTDRRLRSSAVAAGERRRPRRLRPRATAVGRAHDRRAEVAGAHRRAAAFARRGDRARRVARCGRGSAVRRPCLRGVTSQRPLRVPTTRVDMPVGPFVGGELIAGKSSHGVDSGAVRS